LSSDKEEGDPFIKGWDEGLTGDQPEIVKTLVEKGISEGYTIKEQDRHIEISLWDGKDHFDTLRKIKDKWTDSEVRAAAQTCWEIKPGVLLTGFIDYLHSGNHIMDWKTSSNPERYGLNLDDKSTTYIGYDVQLLIYATWLRKVKGVEGPINIGHTYFQTRNTLKVSSIKHDIQPEVLDEVYDWLVNTVIPEFESLSMLEESQVKTLPVGKKACEKYRGCPYQKVCSESMTRAEYCKVQEVMKGVKKMGLMDKLKSANNAEEVKPKAAPKKEKKEAPVEAPVEALVTGGYTLIIGAAVRSYNSDYITLTAFFNDIQEGICKELGKDNWWSMDPFARREIFASGKEEIINQAQGKTIICRFLEPDVKALLNVLMDDATTIIEGGLG
jgi:hypothetical protein